MALLGYGEIWVDGVRTPADDALDEFEIPQLEPKDAMGLMNHSGLTVARAAAAIAEAHLMMDIAQMTAMLSCAGYGANRDIFDPEVNMQRDEPGQVYAARWFAKVLDGPWPRPRRIQEALSFRTIASIIGTAQEAVERADLVWEDEAFGISDSPVMLEDGRLRSTANFQSPALALELEKVGMALAMVANASVQRMQKLMSPELSKLPRYLSPRGGEAAGMVPLQKTAAALLSDIRRHAMPVIFDPAPVSQSVEDMAPMTPQAAGKLTNLCDTLSTLLACEAMVAAQAIDLHGRLEWPDEVLALHGAIRDAVPKLIHDRPVGPDVSAIETILLQRA
jgi:histidine ammonia-lyase